MRSQWKSRIKRFWISGSSEVYVTDDQFVRLENGPTGKILGDVMSVVTNLDQIILYDLPGRSGGAPPPAPVAGFTSSLGLVLSSSFTDQSTGTPTSWNWDFGDGTTSTSQNPTKVYSAEGSYPISLTASNSGGSSIATGTRVVINKDGPNSWYRPISSFGFTKLSIPVPDYLALCQDASGDLVPTIDTLSVGNLVANASGHLYEQAVPGWNAKFVGFDGLIADQRWATSTASLDMAVSSSYAMAAYFSFATASSDTNRTMILQGTNNALILLKNGRPRMRWNSQSGTGLISHADADMDTVHQFGAYSRADTNASGLETDLESVSVTHNESAWTAQIKGIGTPNTSPPAPSRWSWVAIWKGTNAEFNMAQLLSVLRESGSIPAPTAMFTSSLGNVLSSSFTDQSSGAPSSWVWDFGDGTTSTDQNPSKVYTAEGAYPVSLTASNAGGSAITAGTHVVINKDGPNSWYRPLSSFGWARLGLNSPNLLFHCQDLTGAIAPTIDNVGSGPWGTSNSGTLYRQGIAGWNAYHVGLDGAVVGQSFEMPSASSSLDIPLSSSYAMLGYTSLATPSTSQRWMVIAGNSNYIDISTNGTIRPRHDAVTGGSTTQMYNNIDLIHQIGWHRRCDTDESVVVTNIEVADNTHSEAAFINNSRAIGTNTATSTPAARWNMMAIFTGSNAEFSMPNMFATLREVPGIPRFSRMGTFVATATTMTASWPTHSANDVALLVIETEDTAASINFGSSANFVQVTNSPQTALSGASLGTKLWLYWCRASGSAQEAVTFEDSGNHQCARIITFKNCITTGNPWDVVTGSVLTTPSTTVTMPSVTTTVDHTLVVNIAATAVDSAAAQFSGGTNPDLQFIEMFMNNNTSSGNGGGFGLWLGEKKGSGAVGETTATAATETVQARITIALKGTG